MVTFVTMIAKVTAIYSLKPSAYTRAVLVRWLGRNLLWLSLPVIAALAASFWRLEMLVLAFMLMLLIYPFALLNVYFRYALTRKAAFEVIPHRIVIAENGNLTVEYIPDEEHPRAVEPIEISAGSLLDIGQSRGNVVVAYGKNCGDLLVIPPEAFSTDENEDSISRDEFINRIYEIIRGNLLILQS